MFCGNVAKATKNKKSKKPKKRRNGGTDVPNAKRRAATSALTFMTFS
jgi:hypothetical protein